jgi:chromosome segregation ATPase
MATITKKKLDELKSECVGFRNEVLRLEKELEDKTEAISDLRENINLHRSDKRVLEINLKSKDREIEELNEMVSKLQEELKATQQRETRQEADLRLKLDMIESICTNTRTYF